MERFCDSCGSLINSTEELCPFCGAVQDNVSAGVGMGAASFGAKGGSYVIHGGSSVMQGVSGAAGGSSNSAVSSPSDAAQTMQMSLGKWVGTMILTNMLGIISLILLIVWGFGKDAKEPRKTYCRAALCLFPLTALGSFFTLFVVAALILELNGF